MLTEQQLEWAEKSCKEKLIKKTAFGMYIRYNRLMNHMTIREVAALTGVTGTHINNLELGRGNVPGLGTVYRLCKVFDIDGNTLMKMMEKDYETT